MYQIFLRMWACDLLMASHAGEVVASTLDPTLDSTLRDSTSDSTLLVTEMEDPAPFPTVTLIIVIVTLVLVISGLLAVVATAVVCVRRKDRDHLKGGPGPYRAYTTGNPIEVKSLLAGSQVSMHTRFSCPFCMVCGAYTESATKFLLAWMYTTSRTYMY